MKTGDITQWFADNGDLTLRLDYNLNENSVVFDLGGYHGEWSNKIFDKYKCNIYIFEPIEDFYNLIYNKFKDNNKIKVFNFGISDVNEKMFISLQNDGSSFNFKNENQLECEVKSIIDVLTENNIKKIDLIKINVEGDEYKILNKIITENLINVFDNIQVQFHGFSPNSIVLREQIQNELLKTHSLTYNYEFVWENWEKNSY
jgi:FkbM family methyltransferase